MASSLAALGLCLFGSAAHGQYAGSPQSQRYPPAAVAAPARSAYAPQPRPAVPPLPQPAATNTWRPSPAPATLETIEFQKEVHQTVPVPAPLPVLQQPVVVETAPLPVLQQPVVVETAPPVVQPPVQVNLPVVAPPTAPTVTPASYPPPPVPIAVSGPAPIHQQHITDATPLPVVEKAVELPPVAAPVEVKSVEAAPVLPPVVEAPVELPPVVAPVAEKPVELPAPAPVVEQPVEVTPIVEQPLALPPVATPVAEQPAPVAAPVVEKPAESLPVSVPAVEAPVAPAPVVEKPVEPAPVAVPQAEPAVVATPEVPAAPAVAAPAVAPPPVFPDAQPMPATELPIVAPLPQPWKPTEKPLPPALAAPTAQQSSDINLTALQPPGSAPVPMNTGPAPGMADDGQSNYVQLDPPGPQRLFRLDSEIALQERMRQEALSRPGQDKTEFPTYKPISDSVFAGRSWPCQTMLVEPSYVNYRPLLFQDLNSERYGWDLGFVQPVVSTAIFWKDVAFWPYRRAAFGSCCDSGAGYCLPGDPVPYLLYPPYVSARGALAEAAVIAALVAIFP
ncbi:MAG: hypothetical protein JNM56_38145 [Planctomycetia bacterium]|nr:hypothetical protein [Planctomycetia bacterium]